MVGGVLAPFCGRGAGASGGPSVLYHAAAVRVASKMENAPLSLNFREAVNDFLA